LHVWNSKILQQQSIIKATTGVQRRATGIKITIKYLTHNSSTHYTAANNAKLVLLIICIYSMPQKQCFGGTAFSAFAIPPTATDMTVAQSVLLSHSCTLLKPLDGVRCHL